MSDIADQIEINRLNTLVETLVKARAECERQYQAKVEEVIAQMNRAEAAEAEVERLRAALHSITLSYDERCGIDHATLARSALEAKT